MAALLSPKRTGGARMMMPRVRRGRAQVPFAGSRGWRQPSGGAHERTWGDGQQERGIGIQKVFARTSAVHRSHGGD